jgi:hypothetical protein
MWAIISNYIRAAQIFWYPFGWDLIWVVVFRSDGRERRGEELTSVG